MLDTYLLTIFGPLRGTHDSIESHAFASLTTGEQKNLPRFTSIRIFSGPLGPDTLWLLGRYGADRSRYDPLRRRGGAVDECVQLVNELCGRPLARQRARAAGRLAHTLADLCDPAHHVGRPGRARVRVFGLPRTESWIDPLTGPLWSAGERHNHFEQLLAGAAVSGSPEAALGIVRAHREFFSRRLAGQSVGVVLQETALGIVRAGLWERFISGERPDELRSLLVRYVIFPACGLIAAVWCVADRETRFGTGAG
jgi:hypothetical protein